MGVSEYIAIGALIVALVPPIINYVRQAKRDRAEGDRYIAEAAKTLVDPLRQEVVDLRARVDVLERAVEWYRFGVSLLLGQLQEIGCDPVWHPDQNKEDDIGRTD